MKKRLNRLFHKFYRTFGLKYTSNRYFWTLFIYTHIYVVSVWMEFFGAPPPHPEMQSLYIVFLGAYVGYNEFVRWRFLGEKIKKPGDLMAVMWVLTAGVMYFWNQQNPETTIPVSLFRTCSEVIVIYAGGEISHTIKQHKDAVGAQRDQKKASETS